MTQYYEAILQLRNPRREIIDFVKSEAAKKNAKIVKTEKQKNGLDMQLSSRKFALALGKKLADRYGGKLKTSAKLVGRKNDRNVHRVTVCHEASEYREGDVVNVDNKIVKVKNVGKFLSGVDLVTGKKAKVEIKGKKINKLEKHRTIISKHKPGLEVIHPVSYQSVPVENTSDTKKTKVSVVVSGKKIYIIPGI